MSKLIITVCLVANSYICKPPIEIDYPHANCLFGGIMYMSTVEEGWITKVRCNMIGPTPYQLWKERK